MLGGGVIAQFNLGSFQASFYATMSFKLSASLKGHEQDVRAVISPSNETIVSASRDQTVRVWNKAENSENQWNDGIINHRSTGFINSLAYFQDDGLELIISGGKNQLIDLTAPYSTQEEDPVSVLIGHEANVCSLDSKGPLIISGSWDTTAKVWQDGSVLYNLKGHSASVWDVKIIDAVNHEFLTCSADKTVKKWKGDKVIQTFTGHTDVVRALLPLANGFASCSNDATIRIYDYNDPRPTNILTGHESFIYSLGVLPNGDLVSCGEDRSCRIWSDHQCQQVINLPCVSVWDLSVLPNGDIVLAGSDGNIRVFSEDPARQASEEAIAEFEELLANSAISESTMDNINKEKLPSYEALKTPGKEGQTIMVKSPVGVVEAYSFTDGKWVKIGTVVGGSGNDTKKTYQGKEWDYIFDIDVQEGAPPLKLPYNVSENPFTAAARFLADNDLPATYADQIVKFILSNTKGVELGSKDPLEESSINRSSLKIFPIKEYLPVKFSSTEALIKGVTKLNTTQKQGQLTATQIDEIRQALSGGGVNRNVVLTYATQIIQKWDNNSKLVGLDLLGSIIANVPTPPDNLFDLINTGLKVDKAPNTFMLTLRCLNSIFQNRYWGESLLRDETLINELSSYEFDSSYFEKKNVQIELATMLLNFAVLTAKFNELALQGPILRAISSFAKSINDEEARYRLLTAYGTSISAQKVDSAEPTWLDVFEKEYSTNQRFVAVIKEIKLLRS